MYDYAVYIGRFQPFHPGHEATLRQALQAARKVIMLVGSANLHPHLKNPFTHEERKAFIEASLHDMNAFERVKIMPLNDVPYNNTAWQTQVRTLVEDYTGADAKIVLIGINKDESTYYLDMLPEWNRIEAAHTFKDMNATDVRDSIFSGSPCIPAYLNPKVKKLLSSYIGSPRWQWMMDEKCAIIEAKEKYGEGPHITADAVVTQSGHILLVTRKHAPYKGALALPGGYVNLRERIGDGCIRELKEETKISDKYGEIPAGKLASFVRSSEIFDAPDRDPRGRIITVAYRLVIPDAKELYWVKGNDDAEKAQWYPLHDLDPKDFMGDHWFIIQKMTGIQWK